MPPPPAPTSRAAGFTFIEVMFAVLVLGVGVIMIATMLPVAIRTAKETRESAAGSAAIEAGFHQVEQSYADFGTDSLPSTVAFRGGNGPAQRPWTFPTRAGDWDDSMGDGDLSPDAQAVADGTLSPLIATFGNRVVTSDPTFMWIPFYSRSDSATDAPQLALVGVRARNFEQFPTSPVASVPSSALYPAFFDLTIPATPPPSGLNINNYPIPVMVRTFGGSVRDANGNVDVAELDTIALTPLGGVSDAEEIEQAAVDGAAVVVVDALGRLKVYRLGQFLESGRTGDLWQLQPDGGLDPRKVHNNNTPADTSDDYNRDEVSGDNPDITGDPNRDDIAVGYLIGRQLEDPSLPWDVDNPYVGPSQVVRVLDGKQLPSFTE